MKNKYVFVAVMLVGILLAGMGLTSLYVRQDTTGQEAANLTVVTSFYPMYIAAANVVGDIDGVRLENLSEPQTGCLHDFQLTPEDMKLLSTADVFIVNGGGIESFMEEVAEAYPDLIVLEACKNTTLLKDEDGENAHAWMSVIGYEMQVQTIAAGLGEVDTAHREDYEQNAAQYIEKLIPLVERQQAVAQKAVGQSVILFHEAYAYVARDYGLTVSLTLDLDEERQVSAGEVAEVLSAVREDGVSVILAEELYGKSMAQTVQQEADVTVVYLDPLNRGDYDKDSYLEGMTRNIELLEQAFGVQEEE
jgi:zinc transport system substrate-binding protein